MVCLCHVCVLLFPDSSDSDIGGDLIFYTVVWLKNLKLAKLEIWTPIYN